MFASDNTSGVHPQVLRAVVASAAGIQPSYGADDVTAQMERRFAQIFECEAKVFIVSTGTAANALALSQICAPFGGIFCDQSSHIAKDESGAPEFFTGGAKLVLSHEEDGKVSCDAMDRELVKTAAAGVHATHPKAVSVTQATERGTVYTLGELADIGSFAKEHGLGFHMDGARFANALVSLGCTPAQMTWKVGVDVLSFGATKNGALAAEAIVFFNEKLATDFEARRKRAGQLFSKMRFFSAQFIAYFEADLWLENARHGNKMAQELSHVLMQVPGTTLCYPVEANEVFVSLDGAFVKKAQAAGYDFYNWAPHVTGDVTNLYRFVTHFATRPEDIREFKEFSKGFAG